VTDTLEGRPDWSLWGQMQEVKLCEAVALLLNLNPNALEWDRFENKFEAGVDFDRRLRISVSHAASGGLRLLAHCGTTHNSPVNLQVFAIWATGVWQDLPEELRAIAQNATPMGTQEQVNTPAIAIQQANSTQPQPRQESSNEWVSEAQSRAYEIIKERRAKDLCPNQLEIADQIAREFRAAGKVGAAGKPLSGAYIKRHALPGINSARNKQLSTSNRQSK
jgi:hypothetical protein